MNIYKNLKSVNALIISFVLAGVLIGVLVAAQFQSSVAANSYLVDELNAQKELLSSFDEDRTVLKNNIALLKQKLEEMRRKMEVSGSNSTLDKLEELRQKAGLTKVSGKGVKITFGEGTANKNKDDSSLIHASDLRDLINLIRTARINGISINGQRVIATSTITSLGDSILVNKVKVAGPFEINIIGNTEMIVSRINDQRSYPDLYKRIKDRDVSFDMQKLEVVNLPAYDGDYLFKYVQIK